MDRCMIPADYKNPLSIYETQCAIEFIKHNFQKSLCRALNLLRVSAPLFVEDHSGLNDDLNGYERAVAFDVPSVGSNAQVVHSLAKWKRMALARYNFPMGRGLVTDMNAIRRDETVDNIHSVYVDQWDWEKVISKEDRTLDYLKDVVQRIVNAIYVTGETLKIEYPQIKVKIPREVLFLTTQELEDMFPELTDSHEKENALHRMHKDKAIFLMQIGGKLRSGRAHDGRAPDYDDWSLNGDILFWNEALDRSFEISSMGIRVDPETLDRQLTASGMDKRRELPFHKALLNNELPLTVGGGIGQSRLCMLLIGCCHIGEVQSGIWDPETHKKCKEAAVMLL